MIFHYPAPIIWEITLISVNDDILGTFLVEENPNFKTKNTYAHELQAVTFPPQYHRESGSVKSLNVYRNGKLYAICPTDPYPVIKGNQYKEGVVILKCELVPEKVEVICTCGGWVCYGKDADLHSFDCDLRKI